MPTPVREIVESLTSQEVTVSRIPEHAESECPMVEAVLQELDRWWGVPPHPERFGCTCCGDLPHLPLLVLDTRSGYRSRTVATAADRYCRRYQVSGYQSRTIGDLSGVMPSADQAAVVAALQLLCFPNAAETPTVLAVPTDGSLTGLTAPLLCLAEQAVRQRLVIVLLAPTPERLDHRLLRRATVLSTPELHWLALLPVVKHYAPDLTPHRQKLVAQLCAGELPVAVAEGIKRRTSQPTARSVRTRRRAP